MSQGNQVMDPAERRDVEKRNSMLNVGCKHAPWCWLVGIAILGCALEGGAPARAQLPPAAPEVEVDLGADAGVSDESSSIVDILLAGGLVGYVIMFLSVAAVALAIEHAISIRANVLMPPGLSDRVADLLASNQLAAAEQQCKLQPSFLASVLHAGLVEADGGWAATEKAMEDGAADQAARLFRKIEYLSVIANLAPMLGLLGTVIGMVFAFREVAITQGAARAADLAEGIYLALVTTVEGLLVAIPCLAVYAFFRSRVDQLVAEVSQAAQHATAPLRRRRGAKSAGPPAPPRAEGVR